MRTQLRVLLSFALVALASPAKAQDFKWDVLHKDGRVATGKIRPADSGTPFATLQIEGTNQPHTVTVLTIDAPRIMSSRYALSGQVRYENVEGVGYLEMWSHFDGGGQYFSRTLAETGPMMKLQGTSGWRPFTLPFDATGASGPPTKLVVNLALQGRGIVHLGPIALVNQDRAPDSGVWWGEATGGWIGSVVGAAVGSVGALIGVLASVGRGRRFVTIAALTLIVCGIGAFLIGIAALTQSQSYAVYYPLLLGGFAAAVIPLTLMPTIRKRYQELELRAMRAQDLR